MQHKNMLHLISCVSINEAGDEREKGKLEQFFSLIYLFAAATSSDKTRPAAPSSRPSALAASQFVNFHLWSLVNDDANQLYESKNNEKGFFALWHELGKKFRCRGN